MLKANRRSTAEGRRGLCYITAHTVARLTFGVAFPRNPLTSFSALWLSSTPPTLLSQLSNLRGRCKETECELAGSFNGTDQNCAPLWRKGHVRMRSCEAETLYSDHVGANVWWSTIKDQGTLVFYGYWRARKTKGGLKTEERLPNLEEWSHSLYWTFLIHFNMEFMLILYNFSFIL